jgi:acetyl-CoA/propionyl-CoA carboxylase, biotin carboxylase, biotin carboxyl carrier protein
VLADTHGTVVVVGTRDCSLQRRHQKLVEEAPAPFLSDAQRTEIHSAARAICAEAGYQGAGTVEFLVGRDGVVSFLEVNTRLQVEHPVTEETAGIDLVQEQFRIAAGERLTITADPEPRGHAIEFRINGEDPANGFMPAPGTVTGWEPPSGPGVRVDSGVQRGSVVGGLFDSLLAKLIVVGADRDQALARARRALAEFRVEGLPTVLPFHRAVVDDPAFTASSAEGFTVHTRWIERGFAGDVGPAHEVADADPQAVLIEIGGRWHEVRLPGLFAASGETAAAIVARAGERRAGRAPAAHGGTDVTAPMQGTLVRVAVSEGDTVQAGDLVAVVEAMKMENPVTAHRDGVVTGLGAAAGAAVSQGMVLCTIEDPIDSADRTGQNA